MDGSETHPETRNQDRKVVHDHDLDTQAREHLLEGAARGAQVRSTAVNPYGNYDAFGVSWTWFRELE